MCIEAGIDSSVLFEASDEWWPRYTEAINKLELSSESLVIYSTYRYAQTNDDFVSCGGSS